MKKVFLYLYPIKEYTEMFLYDDDSLYDEWGVKRPLPVLNECIQKRYREKGYEIVFVTYPDKDVYGIDIKNKDRIIKTDILFEESCAVDENKNIKKDFIPKYPSEIKIISQLGNVDKLVVGGYHAQDCVKRVAEKALDIGIDTLVDLDLTDLFFGLYKKEKYFKLDEYNPMRYKDYVYNQSEILDEKFIDAHFRKTYSSPVYGFNLSETVCRKK